MTMTWLVPLAVEESDVTPGLLGFAVVALLGFATFLLIRSMNRRLRRIDLPEDTTAEDATAEDATTAGIIEGEESDPPAPGRR